MPSHNDRDTARFDDHTNTRPTGANYITHDAGDDDIDRRGFLRCMAWAGSGLVWGLNGGVPTSFPVSRIATLTDAQRKSIFFAQISDSHIGFSKDANKDVTATLAEAVAKLNALPQNPAFVLHTGDITQLAKPEEFDTANEVLKEVRTTRLFYVPGEQHTARAVRTRAAVDRVPGVGLGNRRLRAGARVGQAIRIRDSAERTHSPDHAESRRQCLVSHRDVDGVSAAIARFRAVAGTNDRSARAIEERTRRRRRHVHPGTRRSRHR
jgi:hypothetical protein